MSDELPPYEGQNWLCLTDAQLRRLAVADLEPVVQGKVQRLVDALDKRLTEFAPLQQAKPIPAGVRTDRGWLEQP